MFSRLIKLKRKSEQYIESFTSSDPFIYYNESFVSDTGLTYDDLSDRIKKLKLCSSIVELKSKFLPVNNNPNDLEQVLSISSANYCKNPIICPVCADRTQSRRRVRFDNPIRNQAKLMSIGKRYAYIVTYTIRDGKDLSERLNALKRAKRTFHLMGQRRRSGKRSSGEASKYVAAVSGIEIKRGANSDLWHVHSHDLVFTDEPLDYQIYDQAKKDDLKKNYGNNIPKEELNKIALKKICFDGELVPVSKMSYEWWRATGGESIGISVEPLKHIPDSAKKKKRLKYERMSFEQSIAYQAKEVLKYPFKPSINKPEDIITVMTSVYNRRMFASYGEFRGIPAEEYVDEAAEDDETFVIIWDKELGRYKDPVPGRLRDYVDENNELAKTRSLAGKILGEYRRKRSYILSRRNFYGERLASVLDSTKNYFRYCISKIWQDFYSNLTRHKKILEYKTDNDYHNGSVTLLETCYNLTHPT